MYIDGKRQESQDVGRGLEWTVTYVEDEMFIPYGIFTDKNTSKLILDASKTVDVAAVDSKFSTIVHFP